MRSLEPETLQMADHLLGALDAQAALLAALRPTSAASLHGDNMVVQGQALRIAQRTLMTWATLILPPEPEEED